MVETFTPFRMGLRVLWFIHPKLAIFADVEASLRIFRPKCGWAREILMAGLIFLVSLIVFLLPCAMMGQSSREDRGGQVLLETLPRNPSRARTAIISEDGELDLILGEHPFGKYIDLDLTLNVVTAVYPEGRLVLLEYGTPQLSSAADKNFISALAGDVTGSTAYKRIGNYNAFVIESPDTLAAEKLLSEIRYEKEVQWLDEEQLVAPVVSRPDGRKFAIGFLSTLLIIPIGLVFSISFGLLIGVLFFRLRQRQRERRGAFSDFGGMTRINIDGLTDSVQNKNE